ncbi:hypothetical protein [Jiangella endophytica]|uniref:hypothetical protein n=1 Tax=Jiangella endophytica TaxID=1623398 RepID=UPI000E342EDD|nr:hypothetical protein [Jiangella endophytica]
MAVHLRTPGTPRLTVRAAAGLSVLALFAAGCGGESAPAEAEDDRPAAGSATPAATDAPEVVPWAEIETYLAARHGYYRKFDNLAAGGEEVTMTSERVQFDLDVPYHDRSIDISAAAAEMLPDEPLTGSGIIRFVTTDTVVLMRNPAAQEPCGTPWVDMTAALEDRTAEFGLPPADPRLVEPFDVLRSIVGEPEPVRVDADGTLYEITVPDGVGLSLSGEAQTDPGILATIAGMESAGQVWLPADGGQLQVNVDYTDIVMAVTGNPAPDDTTYTSSWFINTDIAEIPTDLPPDVADLSCMDQGADG